MRSFSEQYHGIKRSLDESEDKLKRNMILFCLTFQKSIKRLNIKEIVCMPLNIMKRSKPQKVS